MEKEIESVWCDKEKQPFKLTDKTLYDKLVIVDFGKIFQPLDKENSGAWKIENQKALLDDSKDLIENGFDMYFEGGENPVHMVAFDKSGSMSRNSRISFIDEDFYEGLNTRLNLGMDFSKIPVIESKYYAYRGLYLSSSKRVKHPKFVINPDTIIIIKDVRTKKDNPEKPVTSYNYDKNIPLATTEIKVVKDADFREVLQCNFQKPQIKDFEYVDIPFDGSGFITPEYASYINKALKIKGATSFQIRLPFMKGMLHEVDVHEFLETYNNKKGEQWYEDAFGIKRDLSKAHIFVTESMFKGMKWILLASLLEDENVISKFWQKYAYLRFYLPVGTQRGCWEDLKLNYDSYYAFFRSPHLSRNEQVIMKRFEMTTEDLYADKLKYKSFKGHIAGRRRV